MSRRKAQVSKRIRIVGGEVQFSMSDPNNAEMIKRLNHYNTAINDFSDVFEEFSIYHNRSIQRNFQAEGRPKRWTPLTEATIEDRLRKGYSSGPILVRSGRLMRGFRFTWRAMSYSVRNIAQSRRGYRYFNVHQYGYPPHNLPARPMLVLLAQDKAQFTKIARKHLGFDE